MPNVSTPIVFPNSNNSWTAGIPNRLEWDWSNITKSTGLDTTVKDNTTFYDGSSFTAIYFTRDGPNGPEAYQIPDLKGFTGSVGVDVPKEVPAGNYAVQFNVDKPDPWNPETNISYAFNRVFQILPAVDKTVESKPEDDSSPGLSRVSQSVLGGLLALTVIATFA